MKVKSIHLKLAIVFLIAFLARLIALNQSLWLDEGVTARVVQQFSIPQIITQFSPGDFHPPLFYILEKIWTSIFGYSEVSLRFPSVIFSLITGWIVYKIGKFLRDETTGLWAALFFLFNPLIIYYSQEARMYLMVTCFLTAALYYCVKILKKTSTKDMVLFNFFVFLSFLSFYGSIFFIIALYAVYFLKTRKYAIQLLPGIVLSVVLVSPLLFQQLLHSRESLAQVANWKAVLGQVNLKNLILIPIKFVTGRISFDPKAVYYAFAGIWTITVFIFGVQGFQKKKELGILFVLPIALGVIFSFVSPQLEYFRFLYLIVPLVVAVSLAVNQWWQKILLLSGFILFSLLYLFFPQFYREDWKSLAAVVPNQKVYAIPASMDALRYYNSKIDIEDIRQISSNDREIVVIPYTLDIYGLNYHSSLAEKGYRYEKTVSFRGVSFELWKK